ncbi:trp operon leader peptide [Streptomyces sp. NPDC126499]
MRRVPPVPWATIGAMFAQTTQYWWWTAHPAAH